MINSIVGAIMPTNETNQTAQVLTSFRSLLRSVHRQGPKNGMARQKDAQKTDGAIFSKEHRKAIERSQKM
jgi:hypothetical protein